MTIHSGCETKIGNYLKRMNGLGEEKGEGFQRVDLLKMDTGLDLGFVTSQYVRIPHYADQGRDPEGEVRITP